MVVELTQESFQTGKAIVTVSVDLITAIEDACKSCAAYYCRGIIHSIAFFAGLPHTFDPIKILDKRSLNQHHGIYTGAAIVL